MDEKFVLTIDDLTQLMSNKNLKFMYDNVESLASKLNSDCVRGLDSDDENFELREKTYGNNFIPPRKPTNFFIYLWRAFQDTTLIILICAAFITLVIGSVNEPEHGWIEGLAILIAVLIVSLVTAVNDYQKELQFTKLQKKIKLSNIVTVLRSGVPIEIASTKVLVGDVLLVKYGDQLTADCILIADDDLHVDESSLTGESDLVLKTKNGNPYLLSGTNVMQGSGRALVVAVGINSQSGQVLKLLGVTGKDKKPELEEESAENSDDADDDKVVFSKTRSILQSKLTKMALLIGKVGLAVGIIVTVILVLRFCLTNYIGANKRAFVKADLSIIFGFLLTGISILIVAIPEGLPLAVTLSLAFSVYKMLRDNNLVRQLYSCETMGNATTICSDKTGTLTTNRMTVVQVFCCNRHFKDALPKASELSAEFINLLCSNIATNKSIESNVEKPKQPGGLAVQTGNKTECALLGLMLDLGRTQEEFQKIYANENTLKIFPFNSAKKLMVVVVKHQMEDGSYVARAFVKGAPEFLMVHCKDLITKNDLSTVEINESVKKHVKCIIEEMGSDALRIIALAYKDFPLEQVSDFAEEQFLNGLTAICLVGIEDPVRPEVPSAIGICKKAGVVVRMVTGDNIITAKSIAIKCGIYDPNSSALVMDSVKFNRLIRDSNGQYDQTRFDRIWPRLRVLARSTPQDKYTLVNGIIESKRNKNREVVAVTGDGTNDAPALKKAHVGFAMGISGTDVAKEASDIIITDDNFASIVKALMWGRNVYDAISKFLQFQLTVNIVAILISIISTMIFGINVLQAIQLLWVNLIMDSFASLALATDEPTIDLLKRPPYGRDKNLISSKMLRFIFMHSIYQIFVLLLFMFGAPIYFHIPNGFLALTKNIPELILNDHLTLCFNVFVFMQIFNEINARRVHGERNVFRAIWANRIFVGVAVVTTVIQIIIVEFSSLVFKVTALDAEMWVWCLFFGFGELLWHQIVIALPPFKINKKLRRNAKHISLEKLSIEENFDDEIDLNAATLWIRGINRLKQQLRVVKAFRASLDPSYCSDINTPEFATENKMNIMNHFAPYQKSAVLKQQWSVETVPPGDSQAD